MFSIKKYFLYGIILFLFPCALLANIGVEHYKSYDFLVGGFNMHNYRQCIRLIKKCPREEKGRFLNQTCVNRVLNTEAMCYQYKSLLQLLDMPSIMITLKKLGMFAIVKIHFIADGQDWYQIITPEGKLIDTKIDPRDLSKFFAKKYAGRSFIVVNWSAPIYHLYHYRGVRSITVILRVTEGYRAGPVVGWARVKFDFTKDGKLLKVILLDFGKRKKLG